MKTCMPCHSTFRSWRMFARHMLEKHQVSTVNLRRRVLQMPDGDLFVTQSERGRWYLVSQPPLL